MDNQDQRRTHTQGHENHGVHVCHKCGWPFPNPHPSAKHRRAHKKICGTIEGYKLLVSESQTHSVSSDDEHLSDDDRNTKGPNALDAHNNEKDCVGTGENLNRSGDEVFLDAIANFSDGGLSPGNKEALRDSLDSATDMETVDRKYPDISGYSEDNDFNAGDVNQLIVKSRDDGKMQDPNILQSERGEDGKMLELKGQLLNSSVDPLSNSITDLRTKELTVAHSDDCFGLSSDSIPSKAGAAPAGLLENKIFAGENMRDCSLTSVAKETDLKAKGEIKSDRDMAEIVVSSYMSEICEGITELAVSDVVNLDCQVASGAFNLKDKNSAEFLSVMPQDELPLEVNSSVSTNASRNGVQVESAHMTQFATSSDVKMLQERGEGKINVFTHPSFNDGPGVAHPQNEYEDVEDHAGVSLQNSLSFHSSETLKQKQDDLKDYVAEENNFLINQSQMSEKREVQSLNVHVLDSTMKEQNICELVDEEKHAEESIEVSSVKFMVESDKRLVETGTSVNAMKTEINESYMIHFSEEHESDYAHKNLKQIASPEGSFLGASKENPSDASFGGSTTETTSVISSDNVNHLDKNIKEINDAAVDGECKGANVKNEIGISIKTSQPNNLHLEGKPSSGVYKSDEVVDMGKIEKCDIIDAQCTERPIVKDTSLPKSGSSNCDFHVVSEVLMDRSVRMQKGDECASTGPLSSVQEDIKDNETNSNGRRNEDCNRFFGFFVDSHEAQDEELSVKAAEDLGRNYSSLPSLNIKTSAQCISVVEDTQDVKPGKKVFGSTAVPVQDRTGGNEIKLASSAIYTSVDCGNQCDSLERNQGSVSVSEGLPSTDLLASTEAGKSNLKDPNAASEGQQYEKSEMFEPPSFMTLVEPGHMVGPKVVASKVQKGPDEQHPNSTSSQAGWFPTITHVTNESQGRKRNEETIAKITNLSTSKQHTPLKSLLGEAARNKKPKSPKLGENSVNQKTSEVREDNGSGLTTVNSILGAESPSTQAVKGEGGKEWNSPARYPAGIKRQNKKVKSRPFWIQFVCCSSVDPQRR